VDQRGGSTYFTKKMGRKNQRTRRRGNFKPDADEWQSVEATRGKGPIARKRQASKISSCKKENRETGKRPLRGGSPFPYSKWFPRAGGGGSHANSKRFRVLCRPAHYSRKQGKITKKRKRKLKSTLAEAYGGAGRNFAGGRTLRKLLEEHNIFSENRK